VSALRLYSYWRSSASYRVRIALELKGLDYEYLPVHLVQDGGLQHSAAYREINPQARVPTLVTPAGVLTQSMAIMEWLEETYAEPALLPANAYARAQVRGMAQLLVADIQPLQNLSVTAYLRETVHADEAAIKAWLQHWISRGLGAFEELLARQPQSGDFCLGTTPTLADVCLVPQCYSARRFGVDPSAWPRIVGIEQICAALPAFQRAAPEQQPDAAS
jgi:maleylacetoacetate isomerase